MGKKETNRNIHSSNGNEVHGTVDRKCMKTFAMQKCLKILNGMDNEHQRLLRRDMVERIMSMLLLRRDMVERIMSMLLLRRDMVERIMSMLLLRRDMVERIMSMLLLGSRS